MRLWHILSLQPYCQSQNCPDVAWTRAILLLWWIHDVRWNLHKTAIHGKLVPQKDLGSCSWTSYSCECTPIPRQTGAVTALLMFIISALLEVADVVLRNNDPNSPYNFRVEVCPCILASSCTIPKQGQGIVPQMKVFGVIGSVEVEVVPDEPMPGFGTDFGEVLVDLVWFAELFWVHNLVSSGE